MPKYWGIDYLGGARYGKVIEENHPDGFAAGFFANVEGFGDALPVVSRLIATHKCPCLRIQLCWDDDHEYADKFKQIANEAKRWVPIVEKYSYLNWHFSGACEHKLNKTQAKALAELVIGILPRQITYVNCPMKGGAMLDVNGWKIINEVHLDGKGEDRAPKDKYIFSYDGQPCTDFRPKTCQEIKDKYSEAEIFFFWDARCNGHWEWIDPTLPPEIRKALFVPRFLRKGWPDGPWLKSLAFLENDMGNPKLPDNMLWKSHSENKGTGDERAELPVFITPIKAKKITLHNANGGVVSSLPYYGTYLKRTHRYYAKGWGFRAAYLAHRQSGSMVCEVRADGKKIGTVNPAFRFGKLK